MSTPPIQFNWERKFSCKNCKTFLFKLSLKLTAIFSVFWKKILDFIRAVHFLFLIQCKVITDS